MKADDRPAAERAVAAGMKAIHGYRELVGRGDAAAAMLDPDVLTLATIAKPSRGDLVVSHSDS